jgi:hypothetical protein
MALFKMDPTYGFTPDMMSICGSFVGPSATGVANSPILQVNLPVTATVNNGQVAPTASVSPRIAKITVIANPNYNALPGPGLNMLPQGMLGATGASVNNTTFCLNLQGFPADIIQAQTDVVQNTANLSTVATQTSFIAGIDNTYKLVYIQVTTLANPPVLSPLAAPSAVHFNITLKDGALTA